MIRNRGWILSVLLALATVLGAVPASGAGAGWTPTGSLNKTHRSHTATWLANGRVLVAGSSYGNGTSSAELYDPTTGLWTETGSISSPRAGHTATRLRDGRVLVAGGRNGDTYLASAEIYDPATGIWRATGSMNKARAFHGAALLANGRVLVMGGRASTGELSSAELYDPSTGQWTFTAAMHSPRSSHGTAGLDEGRVLVAGGEGAGQNKSEVYSLASGQWLSGGNLHDEGRFGLTTTLLPGGRVLAAGGLWYDGLFSHYVLPAEIWDPATNQWTYTGSLNVGRCCHTAIQLPGGQVLVTGGSNGESNALDSTELYDPGTGLWSVAANLNQPRGEHTATPLADGRVLVAGGHDGQWQPISSAELYGEPAARGRRLTAWR